MTLPENASSLPTGSASIFFRIPFDLAAAAAYIDAPLPAPPPLVSQTLAGYLGRPDDAYEDYYNLYLGDLGVEAIEGHGQAVGQQRSRYTKQLNHNQSSAYTAESIDIAPEEDDRHRLGISQRLAVMVMIGCAALLLLSSLATFGYAFYNNTGEPLLLGALLGFPIIVGGIAGKALLSTTKCNRMRRYGMMGMAIGTLGMVLAFAGLAAVVYSGNASLGGGGGDDITTILGGYTFEDPAAGATVPGGSPPSGGLDWMMIGLFMTSIAAEFMGSIVCFGGASMKLKDGHGRSIHVNKEKAFALEQLTQFGDRDAERLTMQSKLSAEVTRRKNAAKKYATLARSVVVTLDNAHQDKVDAAEADKPDAAAVTALLAQIARDPANRPADVQRSLFERTDEEKDVA